MTVWDEIYKEYKKGGDAWATLGRDLLPRFVKFIENNDFKDKAALDIGCGPGIYLKFLQGRGIKADGLDSSPTAAGLAKKLNGSGCEIFAADMYSFQIPENKYDLIYSISTIHHGPKDDIIKLIDHIYSALRPGGKIFITLPDMGDIGHWDTFKNREIIGPGTYTPLSGPEKGLAHSFFSKSEIDDIFARFRNIKMELDEIGHWVITGEK